MTRASLLRVGVPLAATLLVLRVLPGAWCGWDAAGWFRGDETLVRALADDVVAFERTDEEHFASAAAKDRFSGEWALVTHQMNALGLAQLCLAHPFWRGAYGPTITIAAVKAFRPEMRDFGTKAWGEDALASLDGPHGHAYLAYSALAVGMARMMDPAFPRTIARRHDALIAAYERRLLASPTGLIETYPGEAYPTDVAAVAAAIAVHGRATGKDHSAVLKRWASLVLSRQVDPASGLVYQRMGAVDGQPHDAPRGSGTGLAAYFAGYADRDLARTLTDALLRHESTFAGFGAVREYAAGHSGWGDVDSGPVLLGVSVAATGFALGPARAFGRRDDFERLYRTADLFGLPWEHGGRLRFCAGGPIGNALLLAFLTSGPEVAQ